MRLLRDDYLQFSNILYIYMYINIYITLGNLKNINLKNIHLKKEYSMC